MALFTALCAPGRASADPLAVRGWLVHSPDRAYLDRVLEAAPRYHVNHLELSHDIVMQADEVTSKSESAALIEDIASRAALRGIKTYIWAHELNTRDPNLVLDPAARQGLAFWEARQAAYRRALKACPSVAGVVLMFGSSPTEVWDTRIDDRFWRKLAMPDRVRFVVEKVKDVVVAELHKELFVRDFNHGPQQLAWLIEGLRDNPQITAVSKPEPQDFQPFYPPSPALGALGSTPQILELDLNGEYWGQSLIPVAQVPYLKRLVQHGVSQGIVGAVGRIDTYDHSALGTPSEINLYALGRFLEDPGLREQTVYDGWIRQRFNLDPGPEAGRTLGQIVARTFPMAEKMFYTQGFWTWKDQSSVPDFAARIDGGIVGKSVALWDPARKAMEQRLVHPDGEIVRAILAEKRAAVGLADENVRALANLREHLSATDYADFERRLRLAADWSRIYESIDSAYWRTKLSATAPDTPEADPATCAAACAQLETYAGLLEQRYGDNRFLAKQVPRLRALAVDLRKLRASRKPKAA